MPMTSSYCQISIKNGSKFNPVIGVSSSSTALVWMSFVCSQCCTSCRTFSHLDACNSHSFAFRKDSVWWFSQCTTNIVVPVSFWVNQKVIPPSILLGDTMSYDIYIPESRITWKCHTRLRLTTIRCELIWLKCISNRIAEIITTHITFAVKIRKCLHVWFQINKKIRLRTEPIRTERLSQKYCYYTASF